MFVHFLIGILFQLSCSPARAAEHDRTASAALLKTQLLREYGVRALDKTDTHSPIVLQNVLFLLRNGFSRAFLHRLGSFRYLFAYAGHDDTYDLGAFHAGAKAISIAGESSFPGRGETRPDSRILATVAHEIGHAFLLEKLSVGELREISAAFGGWSPVLEANPAQDLYAKAFFTPHPLRFSFPGAVWKQSSLCSPLSAKNIHEWFADAFAAAALQRLGKKGLLGPDWRERIRFRPRGRGEYWTDYNLVSEGFLRWLEDKISSEARRG